MTRREWLVGVAAGVVLAALIVTGGGYTPPRTIGMDPRVELVPVALPEAVAVGETVGVALFMDAFHWGELERVAREQAAARAAAARPRSGGGGGSRCGGNALECIKECESHGDYGAVSSGGTYRGAYQFAQGTWESVGGTGDPAAASPEEQDARAQALYDRSGSAPWGCG